MTALAVNLAATSFASDGLLRSALENSPDCVKILDLDGRLQFINRNGVILLGGGDAGALLGRSWLGLWDDPERAVAAQALDAAARCEVQRFTAPTRTCSGELRHFDVVLSPLRNDRGECIAILVTSRDVTEREMALLAAEARERTAEVQAAVLRSAAEMTKLAGWEIDFRQGLLVQSEESVRLLRGGPRVLPMERGLDMYDPEDHAWIGELLARARDHGERISYEARYTRADGTRGWVRIFGEPVYEEGVCVGLRGAGMDITDEKVAQEAIQRAEQRLLLAIQLAGLRVYELDFPTHTVTRHGASPIALDREPAFEDIWPPGDNTYMHPRDVDRVKAQWASPDAGETPIRSEFRVLRSDGEVRWAFTVTKVERDATGQPLRLLAAGMDITERKRAELEMLQAMRKMREHQEHQKLLLDELNHRVKNTLASVQSVAGQTLRDAHDLAEARELFVQRLMALSATHNLLVKTAWEGASFGDLVAITLKPYGRPFACTGPDLRLDPNFAISFGMALHELTINAVKHGAWKGSGRIDIAVENGEEEVVITWRESGGPPVTQPARRGFGSRLLERGVAGEVHGEVRLDFVPSGVICTIRAPLSARLQAIQPEAA
ncbi:PAS domain-containing protein [Phenylobacterium sp.]|uniref:PAS domain-containing protein n=1 Tax=Phenylobacterium sp. TaxID=1871053 RepID=UPI002EDA3460